MHDNGRDDIYLGTYEGLYCVSCEAYYTEDELVDGMCPVHGRPVERMVEENYFFRLSAYADRLLEHYERRPEAVQPETRRNEVLSLIRGGLQDFSISRTNFRWGIPLPWDPKHVCYVWFDALTNYITAAGYGTDEERFSRVWPANVHLIGKDILRFHAVYWPAMLMAGGVEPPEQVWAHGYLTVGGQKMSKTNATGIHPFELADHFGVDSYRYFFMREIQFGQDGSFSWESMVDRHNADLANGLGNLASRILAMLAASFDGVVPEPDAEGVADDLPALTADVARRYDEHMTELALTQALGRGVGDRRTSQRVPRRTPAVEPRQGRGPPGRARGHPVRVGRDPADPGDPDRADHAAGRGAAVGTAGDRRAAGGAAAAGGRRLGRSATRDEDRQRRPAVPPARLLSEGSRRHVSRGTHLLDFRSRAAGASPVALLRIFEPGSRIGGED